jgi:hypothetical protein
MHDGGMSATTADLARFGVMLLAGGEAGGNRVVPAEWLAASWNPDADVRNAFAGSFDAPYLPGGWYHNQFWFLPRAQGDVLLCLGINGQMLYVDPTTGTVAAKTSSWPEVQSPTMLYDTISALDAVAAVLAGHPLEVPPADPGPRESRPGCPAVAPQTERTALSVKPIDRKCRSLETGLRERGPRRPRLGRRRAYRTPDRGNGSAASCSEREG